MAEARAGCHVSLTVNLEGMTVERRLHGADPAMHYGKKSQGRYPAAVGAARLFAMFEELGVRATVFVPGAEAEEHPRLVRAIAARGHEIAAMGYAHEDYVGATEETALLERTHDVLTALCGETPKGWRAPTGLLEPETLQALSHLGYAYDASNQDDDFPYRLDRDGGTGMIELPQTEILIDRELNQRRVTRDHRMTWWREEFHAYYEERCYVQLTVSPRADFGSGRAADVEALKGFLSEILALEDVRLGTCAEALAAIGAGTLYCRG